MLCPYVRAVVSRWATAKRSGARCVVCGLAHGGCGMAGTACHPAPEPRALGPLGSCACSVQTTHEHIVKHQHRRPVHFFASPHTARKNLRRAGRRRAPAPRNLVLKLQASNFEALDARSHAKEPRPELIPHRRAIQGGICIALRQGKGGGLTSDPPALLISAISELTS